jgi:hypothetical protein
MLLQISKAPARDGNGCAATPYACIHIHQGSNSGQLSIRAGQLEEVTHQGSLMTPTS